MRTQIIDIGRGEVVLPPPFINRRSYKFARFFLQNWFEISQNDYFLFKVAYSVIAKKKEGVKSFPGIFRKMKISLYDN